MDTICLSEIYRFCNATPTTRNMVEGENVLNSGHIINCGYVNKNEMSIGIFATCLQTSSIRDKPHEINGNLHFKSSWEIIELNCTCKAGASQRCKHVVSVLLHIFRSVPN